MGNWHIIPLIVSTLLAVAGCNNGAASSDVNASYAQAYQVDLLNSEIDGLKHRVASLENADQSYPFKLGDEGFDFIKTNAGGGTLQWVGSKDNGNGVALRLKFGNPTTATWNKFTINGTYGKLGTDGKPTSDPSSSFAITVNQAIPSGSWKTITVQLDGPKAQDVGYLSVSSIRITSIALNAE